MTGGPVKVLIVDDAPIVRNVLTKNSVVIRVSKSLVLLRTLTKLGI